ncbi:hypothetical protein BCT65_018080 [Vibrio splendidus]|uniref:hypothetical protein n=1 Tax=Vibrio splendidus TaxID=29497 RepID=UPI000C8652A8|nr:hypothetical protein [Vibrio splendidus]MCC5518950.1 hypothetical protein [Vibrio splendidus]
MKEFNVLKKNRKYFAALLNGCKCRIVIDENSSDLPLGEQLLDVEDMSVRSKYGTDLIFKLTSPIDEQKESGLLTLESRYNTYLIEKCRALGGQWDKSSQSWMFSGLIAEQVDELDYIFNSSKIAVEVTVDENYDVYEAKGQLCCLGYPVARAFGRDSGAKVEEKIGILAGGFTSSGSVKNWATQAEDGTVFRFEVAEEVYNQFREKEPQYRFKRL